jgi:hypothetical protein
MEHEGMAEETFTRRNLPHWYMPSASHFVTFRLAGTLPEHVLADLRARKERLLLPDAPSRAKLQERHSSKYTEKYADYLNLGVIEWRKVYTEHEKLGKKAILFVMTDDTKNCDDVGAFLEGNYPDLKGAVMVIHTKNNGEISEAATGKNKEELEELRKQANEIDGWDSPYKAIISVMMLREGWDVRNVTTIVGLRPYAAVANILPEQTWAGVCVRCTPITAKNMSAWWARTHLWTSWNRFRPRE